MAAGPVVSELLQYTPAISHTLAAAAYFIFYLLPPPSFFLLSKGKVLALLMRALYDFLEGCSKKTHLKLVQSKIGHARVYRFDADSFLSR